jgi:hypothetical protein
MPNLSHIDQLKLEKLLKMEDGYVLDFKNSSFKKFILASTQIDIYDDKYNYNTGSKANRLRTFFKYESNNLVAKLLKDLLDYYQYQDSSLVKDNSLYQQCIEIINKLNQDNTVTNFDFLERYSEDKNFELLSKSIKENLANNQPELVLDRLHTWMVKYVRKLCDNHKIEYDKNKSLNSLFGEYVKKIKKEKIIESIMTEKILKTSISVLADFDHVRNHESFTHDNNILNYHESILIINDILNLIEFLESIEEL